MALALIGGRCLSVVGALADDAANPALSDTWFADAALGGPELEGQRGAWLDHQPPPTSFLNSPLVTLWDELKKKGGGAGTTARRGDQR